MADLLAHQLCASRLILPPAEEQLAQEWIQGLLLTAQILIPTAVLLLQRAEEPGQY